MTKVKTHPQDQIRFCGMYSPPGSMDEYYCFVVWLKVNNNLPQARVEQFGQSFIIYVDENNFGSRWKDIPSWWPSRIGYPVWERQSILDAPSPFQYIKTI